jgi:hypothetical protein
MPVLNFLNNNNKNHQQDAASNATTTINSSSYATDGVRLPSEECRCIVGDRIMIAAANIVTKQVISTSQIMESSKQDSSALARQQAYKDRLQGVLGSQHLYPIISTCLVIDPSSKQKTNTENTVISLHDVFACISLLLCNFVLLTASNDGGENNQKSSTISGYDARIRNVIRMASIDLLTEALQREDTDGTLWNRLKQKRKTNPKVKSIEDVVEDGSTEDIVESHLSDLLEAGYTATDQQQQQEAPTNDED